MLLGIRSVPPLPLLLVLLLEWFAWLAWVRDCDNDDEDNNDEHEHELEAGQQHVIIEHTREEIDADEAIEPVPADRLALATGMRLGDDDQRTIQMSNNLATNPRPNARHGARKEGDGPGVS